MLSVKEHPHVVEAYIRAEVEPMCIVEVGTLQMRQELGIHCSPFGVIPKKHRWRLIPDLSSPEGCSVNDSISKELASLSYISIDNVVAPIEAGQGSMLAKMDIEQVYRNIPVHPEDRFFLIIQWEGKAFLDTVHPFGFSSAPLLFSAVADALQRIV